MSSAFGLGLLVVLWLFVLAPLLVRNEKPIRRTNDAFEQTRVVYEGGETLPQRHRPRVRPSDVHVFHDDDAAVEIVEADVLIDDDVQMPWHKRTDSTDGQAPLAADANAANDTAAQIIDGEVEPAEDPEEIVEAVSEEATEAAEDAVAADREVVQDAAEGGRRYANAATAPAATIPVEDTADLAAARARKQEREGDEEALADGDVEAYPYDSAYLSPADLLHPAADYEYDEVAAADAETEVDEPVADLTEEDIEYAHRHRGRGGYDPEKDAQVQALRQHRRQRTLLGLLVAVIATGIAGVINGGWLWLLFGVAVVLAVLYMVALRRLVRQEQQLRAMRIAQLRRRRLGVRTAADLDVPSRLRHPGAVVLEVDDMAPDFDELDTYRPANVVELAG